MISYIIIQSNYNVIWTTWEEPYQAYRILNDQIGKIPSNCIVITSSYNIVIWNNNPNEYEVMIVKHNWILNHYKLILNNHKRILGK